MTSSVVYLELKLSMLLLPIGGQRTMKFLKLEQMLKPSHLLQLESLMLELIILVWPLLFLAISQDLFLQSHLVDLESSFKVSLKLIHCHLQLFPVHIVVPTPSFITLTSSAVNSIQVIGSDVILTCTVELNPAVLGSEIFMLQVDAQLSRDGIRLAFTGPTVTGTTFTYTTQLNSFQRSDFGNYTCTATIRPHPLTSTSTSLTGIDILSDTLTIQACKFVPVYNWLHQYAWYLAVIPPPVNIQATQSSSSAPVEVSWSPPSDQGVFNITGYRIFYGSGQNVSIPSVVITSVSLNVNEGYDGKTVFLRSESGQICSELINVTVGKLLSIATPM